MLGAQLAPRRIVARLDDIILRAAHPRHSFRDRQQSRVPERMLSVLI